MKTYGFMPIPSITRHLDESTLQRLPGERVPAQHCVCTHGIYESDYESSRIQMFAWQLLVYLVNFSRLALQSVFFPPSCLHDGFSFQLSYHSDCSCVIRLHVNVVGGMENMVFRLLINSLISLFHSREEWTWWRFFPFCSS